MAGPWLSPGKPTRRAVTTLGSSDLVVGLDHMLGPSCQRFNWKTGKCGSIALGSSPRRGKTDFKPPLSCRSIHLWKGLQEITSRKIRSVAPKGGLMLNSYLSPTAPQGGREPPTDIARVVSTRRRVPTNWFSGRTLQPSIESVIASSFVPSDFLVDGQVSGLGTVHPLLTLSFFGTWIIPLHVFQR